MPRGVPKAGYRRRKNEEGEMGLPARYGQSGRRRRRKADRVHIGFDQPPMLGVPENKATTETDAEVNTRILERFNTLEMLIKTALTGDAPAVIVSGPAGLGKSYTVETLIADWDPNKRNHIIIKGHVKATGLFKTLWQYRNSGQVIVFDDSDAIFFDETSLNMLKAVCDTNEKRSVSYLSEYSLIDDDTAQRIPKTFDFEGTIIFITNYDFDSMVERGTKLAPHMAALMSRAHYIDLMLKSRRDYLTRIKQVLELGLLKNRGLEQDAEDEVMSFITSNIEMMRELSLRSCLKIAAVRKTNPTTWQNIAKITCCKN